MTTSTVTTAVKLCSSDPRMTSLIDPFLSASTTTSKMQSVVHEMTDLIISQAISTNTNLSTSDKILLIPVLRAGLPMYVVAQNRLPKASCVLVRCRKQKGSRAVASDWMGAPPLQQMISTSSKSSGACEEGKMIVLLDTVMATGDTIVRLCDEVLDMGGMAGCVTVVSCYASPEAIEKVSGHEVVGSLVVGFKADCVDDAGYLVPYTHGDIGDKMFGKASL